MRSVQVPTRRLSTGHKAKKSPGQYGRGNLLREIRASEPPHRGGALAGRHDLFIAACCPFLCEQRHKDADFCHFCVIVGFDGLVARYRGTADEAISLSKNHALRVKMFPFSPKLYTF